MVDIQIRDLPKKPFRCLKCGASFGETDGIRLYCGEIAIFTLKVTPTCARCGEPRTWRPVGLKNNLKSHETPAVITFSQHHGGTVEHAVQGTILESEKKEKAIFLDGGEDVS